MTGSHPKQRLNRLVGLVYGLAVRPGLVLNKPPFRLPVVGPRACHNINAYRPFARSGQCADDALADDAPYLTLGYATAVQLRYGITLDPTEIQAHADAEARKCWKYFGRRYW
jgi:hypothetical protein